MSFKTSRALADMHHVRKIFYKPIPAFSKLLLKIYIIIYSSGTSPVSIYTYINRVYR